MFNTERAATNTTTAKQQLLAILQDAQAKVETSNSPATEPLRQNLRKARELAGFLTVSTGATTAPDAEQLYQRRC